MRRLKRLMFLNQRLMLGVVMEAGAFLVLVCDEILVRLDQWEQE